MTIKRISSGGEFEKKVGYCRAVVGGGFVHVAGTVGQGRMLSPSADRRWISLQRHWLRQALPLPMWCG